MDVKILEDFKNKYSKTLYRKGEVHNFSEKRVEEINSTGHGKLVEILKENKEG